MSDFIADDLKNMYLILEKIQKVWWSSSVPHTKIHDECVIALTNMWLENHPVNPKRFGTFINKCKELWMMEKQEYKLQVRHKTDIDKTIQCIPTLHQKHVRRRWFQNDTPPVTPLSLNLWTSKNEINIPKVNILSRLKLNPKEKERPKNINDRDNMHKLPHINCKVPHPPLKAKPSSNNIISRRRQFRF